MEILAGILAGIVLVLAGLWIRELKKRKKLEETYHSQDEMLTRQVADNLDMEKQLKDMTADYENQQNMADQNPKTAHQSSALSGAP